MPLLWTASLGTTQREGTHLRMNGNAIRRFDKCLRDTNPIGFQRRKGREVNVQFLAVRQYQGTDTRIYHTTLLFVCGSAVTVQDVRPTQAPELRPRV